MNHNKAKVVAINDSVFKPNIMKAYETTEPHVLLGSLPSQPIH